MTARIIPNKSKQCLKCEEVKTLDCFGKDISCEDNKTRRCKLCRKKDAEKYRKENKEKIRRGYKKHYDNNKEKIAKQHKKYYDNNVEKYAEYHLKNRVKITERQKKYNFDNKDNHAKYRKDRYNKNREYFLLEAKKYRQTEKGRMVKINGSNKRRAIKRASLDGTLGLTITYPLTIELQDLLERQKYKCNDCGCDISGRKHLDHHIPLSKGGQHSISNVVWLCPSCNMSKGSKMPSTLLLI